MIALKVDLLRRTLIYVSRDGIGADNLEAKLLNILVSNGIGPYDNCRVRVPLSNLPTHESMFDVEESDILVAETLEWIVGSLF